MCIRALLALTPLCALVVHAILPPPRACSFRHLEQSRARELISTDELERNPHSEISDAKSIHVGYLCTPWLRSKFGQLSAIPTFSVSNEHHDLAGLDYRRRIRLARLNMQMPQFWGPKGGPTSDHPKLVLLSCIFLHHPNNALIHPSVCA